MKKLVLALVALFVMTVQASAMSYEQARDQALFLTDKMAYELNLTDDQYEAAYEINLDYLMGINNYNDIFGAYWTQRNLDLSYVLLDWQYRAYVDAAYFYRPLYWDGGYWHFRIYARYPHRDYFYFGCPTFYVSYHGGHSWRMNGGRSWYYGRSWRGPRPDGPRGDRRMGMRDDFDRGDFGRGSRMSTADNQPQNRSFGNGTRTTTGTRSFGTRGTNGGSSFGTRTFGADRQSSTRTTVARPESTTTTRTFGRGTTTTSPRRTFTPNGSSSTTRSFGNSSSSNRSFGSSSTRSFGSGNSAAPSTRSFGSSRSAAPSTRSFGGSTPSAPSRSFGASSRSSGSTGGGHFGRR